MISRVGRRVAGVPERVPLVARLEDEVADLAEDDLVAELRADAALQDEAVLVLVRVAVRRRRERPPGHRVLDEREPAAGLVAVDHEPHADRAEAARRLRPWDPEAAAFWVPIIAPSFFTEHAVCS